jgi:hypothetical protein
MISAPSTPGFLRDRSLHVQCACTLLVAIGAAYVSYRHGRDFALRYGADETTAALWPLIVDGLVRHVALIDRVEVKGLRRRVVAAIRLKLGAA